MEIVSLILEVLYAKLCRANESRLSRTKQSPWRISSRAEIENTGLGFSARPNGLKNPCNRYHFFSPG